MMKATASATDWRHRLINPLANYAARGFVRLHISANMLTVIGFLIVLGAAILVLLQRNVWAGVVMLAGSLIDSVDGAVARLTGKSSKFGAMLDSVLDRLSEGAILIALIYILTVGGEPLVAATAALALLFSLMVSYARARAEGLGISCSEGWFTRVERVIILALGLITGFVAFAVALIAVLSVFTFLQRLYVVWRKSG